MVLFLASNESSYVSGGTFYLLVSAVDVNLELILFQFLLEQANISWTVR